MEFCECHTQLINDEGYCWTCAQPVRLVEVLLFGKMPFPAIERVIQLRAEQTNAPVMDDTELLPSYAAVFKKRV